MGSTERPPRTWQVLRLGSRRRPVLGVLSVWALVERLTSAKEGIHEVRPGSLLRYSARRHRGGAVELRDGTVVEPGDRVFELHLANERLQALTASGASIWVLLALLREDLGGLALRIASGQAEPVKALHGETILAAAGPRLGFERLERRHGWSARLHRFFFAGLVALHNPGGWNAAARKAHRWPDELWLSAGELLRRYGSGERVSLRAATAGRPSQSRARPSPTSAISTSLTAR